MRSGVYTITNIKNNKVYVGCSVDIKHRIHQHMSTLRLGIHTNKHLQAAYDLYGSDVFVAEELEYWDDDFLPSMENYWVTMLRANDRNFGYNIRPTSGSHKATRLSEETKLKMSVVKTGDKHPFFGRSHSEGTKQKLSELNKGKVMSTESRVKMSEASLIRYKSKHPREKAVIDVQTGVYYRNAKEAATAINVQPATLRSWLTGVNPNKTNLQYAA
jgi:group I intron endonuclease